MTFDVTGNVAKIDGSKGKYDKTVTNPSVRYGRNAVENYYTYLEQPLIKDNVNSAPILDFGTDPNAADKNIDKLDKFLKENDEYLNALPPLEYEYRYMPNIKNGQIDKLSVLGAAYEEMGGVKEMSVKEMDDRFAVDESMTSEALDVNKDGKIDIAEYGGSFLAADMLSKSDTPNPDDVDGTISKRGFDAVMAYTQKAKAAEAAKLYENIYNKYNLAEAQNEFDPN